MAKFFEKPWLEILYVERIDTGITTSNFDNLEGDETGGEQGNFD